MNASPRAAELIRKYLDHTCSEAELAELQRLLSVDPAVADGFAQASRLDALLGALLQEEGKIASTRSLLHAAGANNVRRGRWAWRVWTAAAAAVLLVTALALWWRFAGRPQDLARGPHKAPFPERIADDGGEVVSGRVLVQGNALRAVPAGVSLRVPDEQPAVVRLRDGSEATFDPATEAVLHGQVPGLRQMVELVEGMGTFQVEQGNGLFQVETKVGRVTALGTQFSVGLRPAGEKGEPRMKVKGILLAVAVMSGMVQVDFGGNSYVLTGGDNRVFAADNEVKKVAEFRGIVVSVEGGRITVKGGGDQAKEGSFEVTTDVKVLIDGKPGKVSDLSKGMMVFLQRAEGQKGVVSSIRAEGPTVGGEVKSVDASASSITLVGGKSKDGVTKPDETYQVAKDAKIQGAGKESSLADIKPGMRVALRLAVDMKTVVAVASGKGKEEAGKGVKAAVVGGEVKAVDAAKGTITLTGGKESGERVLKVAADAKIVIDGQPAKLADIKTGVRITVKLSEDGGSVVGILVGGKKEGEKKK